MAQYTQLAARVTTEEKSVLVKYCEENDLSLSQVIRRAVKEFLEQQEKSSEDN